MIFPSLPSGMDRVLKEHFDSFRRKGQLPPELAALGKSVKLFDDDALMAEWRNNFKGIRWADGKGNIFRGAVDEILKKGKKLIVLDFKTRGFPIKKDTHEYYQDQLDIYNFLLRKNGYKTEDYAYLLFIHPARVRKNGDVAFDSDLVKMKVFPENALKLFRNALKVLNGKKPKPGEECGFCSWLEEARSAKEDKYPAL